MSSAFSVATAVAWCVGCASAALGQGPESQPSAAEPRQILFEMVRALDRAKSISYRGRIDSKVGLDTVAVGSASVVFRRGESRPATFSVDGNMTSPRRMKFSALLEGDRLVVVDHDRKRFQTGPWDPPASNAQAAGDAARPNPAFEGVRAFLPTLLQFSGFATHTAQADVTAVGRETVGGVLCDVVEATELRPVTYFLPGDDGSAPRECRSRVVARYWIGVTDSLPRKYRSKSKPEDGRILGHEDGFEFETISVGVETAVASLPRVGLQEGNVGGGSVREAPLGPQAGQDAPYFELKDTTGKEHRLAAYAGKRLLVHFSRLEDASADAFLAELKRRNGDRLIVLDLIVDGDAEQTKKRRKNASFPRCVGAGVTADTWGLGQFPAAVFVGPDGRIAGVLAAGYEKADPKTAVNELQKKLVDWLGDAKKPLKL
jgi:hypothetical protein